MAGCPAKRASASHTQCTALVDAVGRAKNMSKAEKAILGEQAMQIPWEVADAATIAHAFSDDMPGSCRARQQLQDFENIHNFFRETEWDCMAHNKATMTVRLDMIINRSMALTLRNPTEFTYKHITSMLFVLGEDPNNLHTLTSHEKNEMMNHVKHQFRACARRAGTSEEHIMKLPPSFRALQRQWPQVASGLGEEPSDGSTMFVESPIEVRRFHSFSQSFRCRGHVNAGSTPTLALAIAPRPCTNDAGVLGQMQQFAMAVMQGMAKMQDQQNMLLASFGTSAAASPHSFHSRAESLPALVNGPRADIASTIHRGTSLESLPVQTLRQQSTASSLDSSAAAHVDASEAQIVLAGSAATLGSAATVDSQNDGKDASVEQNSTAFDGALQLMRALDQRDCEKKKQSKKVDTPKEAAKDDGHGTADPKAARRKMDTPKKRVPCKPKKVATPEKQPKMSAQPVPCKPKKVATPEKQQKKMDTPKKPVPCKPKKVATPEKQPKMSAQPVPCKPKKVATPEKQQKKMDTPKKHVPCKPKKVATPEKQPKTVPCTPVKPKTGPSKKRPHFSLEKNRAQVMCRTGAGGHGSSHAIQFGAGKQFKTDKDALQAAHHWVREQCARLGFE